jgi:CheY-like chemotaxis protein
MLANKWGMLPKVAHASPEVLEWIEKGELFDLAILDMHMPSLDGIELAQAIRLRRTSEELPIVLLSSVGSSEMRVEGLFAARLNKPVKPSQLFEVLTKVFRNSRPPSIPTAQKISTIAPADRATRIRILVAEDNVVNQKVVLSMLNKIGLRADIAANGLEVIQALERQRYDVILMDVEMPEMDGFEATYLIAKKWPNAAERPWIIALTANALDGTHEKCLEAGMNDYLSKPIRKEQLIQSLDRLPQQKTDTASEA